MQEINSEGNSKCLMKVYNVINSKINQNQFAFFSLQIL